MIVITNNPDKYKNHIEINLQLESRELLGKIIELDAKYDSYDDILSELNNCNFIIIDRITLTTVLHKLQLVHEINSILRKSSIKYAICKYEKTNKKYVLVISQIEANTIVNTNQMKNVVLDYNKSNTKHKINLKMRR